MLKIGIFDSGLGGLTVVKALQEHIKGADLFYIADTKHAPYGEKTSEQVLQFSLDLTKYFIEKHHIDVLIVACNTATSAAIQVLRETYTNLIIIGTEPGIKPAIEQTKTGKVGVLATPATLKGSKYQQLASTHAAQKDVMLYEQACPGLVEQIENGQANSPRTVEMIEGWLKPMKENDVDTIVLGCTHYPLVSDTIAHVMQKDLNLVHTGDAIAKHVLSLAAEKGHKNEGDAHLSIYSTGKLDADMVDNILDTYVKICPI